MAKIQIYSDTNKGCIFFDGSTVEPKFIGTIVANVKPDEDRIVIKRTDRLEADGVTFRTLFKRLNPSRVQNEAGENLVTDLGYTTAQVIEYINGEANDYQVNSTVPLTSSDVVNFTLDSTDTTILVDNGDSYAVNTIQAVANTDGHIDIVKHTTSGVILGGLRVANAQIGGVNVTQTLATAVNELNSLFTQTASAGGVAPVITSPTTVNMTEGDTLNYELTATGGVAFEWVNIPQGIATVDGNNRKLIGGTQLVSDTYTLTARAINYYGVDEEDIDLVISTPPYSNTKSIEMFSSDYMGANAALVDSTLGRSGSGSGSTDAWTIAFWYKGGTDSSGQTILYYGSNDVTNGGHIELRYVGGSDKMRLRYGSGNNYIQIQTANDSLPANTWKHVVVSYDGDTTGASSGSLSSYYNRFNIYIDGVAQTPSNAHGNYGWSGAISGQNLRVGRYASGNYQKGGKIDELAMWDSDRSSNVSGIYNGGNTHDLDQLASPPKHWWRMGDGDTYPYIQDNGTANNCVFQMYNMTAANIVTDAP